MKHQAVSVDYWAMGKGMLTYAFLAAVGWLVLRLFTTAFMLPGRMRKRQEDMQQTLQELQKRFPGLNITEQDLKDAEKDLDEFLKEENDKTKGIFDLENNDTEKEAKNTAEVPEPTEDKKTI